MALLHFKNPYDFENPARRVYREGGEIFAGGAAKAKAVGEWVDTKGQSTEAARLLAEDLNKQLDAIREGTRKDLVKLYLDVFALDVPLKESLSMSEVKVNEPKYDKRGLLEVLAMNTKLLEGAFANPDIRLLAYANVYKNFKAKGMDANYLPKNATVWMTAGEVFVKYTVEGEEKTISSLLFPWDIYDEALAKLPEVRAEDAAERARRLEEHPEERAPIDLGVEEDTSDTSPEITPEEDFSDVAQDVRELLTREAISTLQVKSYELERAARELETVKAQYIELLTMEGGLNESAQTRARELRLQIMKTSQDIHGTAETFLDLSAELRARPDFDVRLDGPNLDATEKTLTNVLSITNDTLGDSDVYSVDKRKEMLLADWAISMEILDRRVVGGDIYLTRTEGPELSPRRIVIANERTGEKYTITAVLPTSDEDLPFVFTDPDVKTTVTNAAGEVQNPPSDVNPDIFSLSMYYADVLEKSEAKPKKTDEAATELEPKLSKKKALEAEMESLFVGFNESPESWKRVDAQYKKMVDELMDTRIRALDHYRGSEAAAHLGNIEEAIRLLEVAKENAGDKTYGAEDAQANIDALKSHYGILRVEEPVNRWVTFTPAGVEKPYDKATLEAFKEEFQRTGRFEGYVPAGTYNIGGKTYNVEGTSLAPTEASVTSDTDSERTLNSGDPLVVAADALELTTRFSPRDISNMNDRYDRIKGTEDLNAVLSQFQDDTFNYVTATDVQMPAPNADGTAKWSVVLETAEGERIKIESDARIDLAAVDTYITEAAKKGTQYDRADLIKYLAYRQVAESFKVNTRETRENALLNEKYKAYAARTDVGETYAEIAQKRADQLDISLRLTPEQVALGVQGYADGRNDVVDYYKTPYPQVGENPFFTEVHRRVNEVNPDGSGLWHVQYQLPDGTKVNLQVETSPVDAQAVESYVEAQKVLGKDFNKDALIKYVGYLALMRAYEQEWKKNTDTVKAKYAEYVAKANTAAASAPAAVKASYASELEAAMNDDIAPAAPAEAAETGPEFPVITVQQLNENYSGKGSFTWEEGGLSTSYMGEWADGRPDGVGNIITDDGGTLGPVTFKNGIGNIDMGGARKNFSWDPVEKKMIIIDF